MACTHTHLILRKLLLGIAIAAVLALTGCSHRPPGDGPRGEPPVAAVPNMSAEDTFFDGTLVVEASLGRGFSARGGGAPGGGRGGPGGGSGGRRGGGSMSMGMGMGGGGPGMSMGGGPGGGGPGGGGPGGDMGGTPSGGGMGGRAMHESNQPPVALRLRLTNKSKETIEVKFILCKSDLGDFAVRPEKLALAPDQTAEPDPMTSRLGIPAGDLVLRVSLRMGGKTEQKDLILRKIAEAEPAPTIKP